MSGTIIEFGTSKVPSTNNSTALCYVVWYGLKRCTEHWKWIDS